MTTNPTASSALADLAVGATASVLRVDGEDALADRLRALGFWPGTPVVVGRRSPFGDPTEYRLRGYRLALRREEATRIVVTTGLDGPEAP